MQSETVEWRRRLAEDVLARISDRATVAIERNRTLPGYETLTPDALRTETEAVGRFAIDALLLADELMSPAQVDEIIAPLARMRASLGVPLESVLRGLLFGSEELWDLITTSAYRLQMPDEILRDTWARWMPLTNSVMAAIANTYGAIAQEEASYRDRMRAGFVQRLLSGRWTVAELSDRAAGFGLSMDNPYIPFRARGDTADIVAFERSVRPVISAAYDEDVAGLLTSSPDPSSAEAIQVGLGPASHLSRVHESFAAAGRSLETMFAFDLRGMYSLESLGFLPTIVTERDLGERLSRRYIDALEKLGESREAILQTIRAYFRHGLRAEATARALFVHPNTLRNRLIRFEEVTGADLRNVEDLIGIWWALTRHDLTEAGAQEPVGPPA